jgi:hypothetical protein
MACNCDMKYHRSSTHTDWCINCGWTYSYQDGEEYYDHDTDEEE